MHLLMIHSKSVQGVRCAHPKNRNLSTDSCGDDSKMVQVSPEPQQAAGLMEDKDVMIRFHPRVRELDRNYEKLNNQDFDNGVYHKYAYKQKAK